MKRRTSAVVLLGILLLTPAQVMAGEALKELKGEWLLVSKGDEALPEGLSMKFTFVDDKKIVVQRIFNGKTEEAEIKYEATADGKITISEDGKDQPGTWKIEMGNLILTPADRDDEILLVRPAK